MIDFENQTDFFLVNLVALEKIVTSLKKRFRVNYCR